jgi:rod shape-determining protein MreD
MKRRALMLLIIVLGALLQQLLPGVAVLGGMKPPILGAMALYHALHKGVPDLWIAVFFAALLQDGLSHGSFGPALLTFPSLSLLLYRFRNEIFTEGLVTQLFIGALMGFCTAFVIVVFHSAVGQLIVQPRLVFLRLLGETLLGLVTFPLVARIVQRIEALIPKRRERRWL